MTQVTIKEVSDKTITLSNGVTLGRFCPHEGGDLSFGYIEGGKIRCPLHNLAFCVKTGVSGCKAVKSIGILSRLSRNGCEEDREGFKD